MLCTGGLRSKMHSLVRGSFMFSCIEEGLEDVVLGARWSLMIQSFIRDSAVPSPIHPTLTCPATHISLHTVMFNKSCMCFFCRGHVCHSGLEACHPLLWAEVYILDPLHPASSGPGV